MATAIEDDLLEAFETHSPAGIATALDSGIDVRSPIRGKPIATWLTGMYTRSERFADCVRLLLSRGAALDDPVLAPVLLDDANAVRQSVDRDPGVLDHRTSLACAFTSLEGATLLHVAAEYGCARAARALLDAGADVDARTPVDAHGRGGHTALFHTVNASRNHSFAVLEQLLAAGADPTLRIAALPWGAGFDWETTFFDVTPVSFAQMGLLPQVHRDERDVYRNVARLLEASGRPVPPLDNVPNRYVAKHP